MLKSDTLGLRLSTIKEKLNTLSGLDELTDEQRNEADALTVEYSQKETMWRAAKVVEGDEQRAAEGAFGGGETLDGEARERREIRNKTGFRDYLVAACSGAPVAGAAAEFNTACGVAAGDHVPRELFEAPARERRQSEHRAVTPGPAIDGPVQPVVPYLFEASVISTLGLIFPSVPSGIQQVPAITTAPPADALDEGGAAPSTAAAYTLASRSPKRISGQIEFSVEDLAVHPALESDLSMALQGSMSNQLDETAINGNNAGGDLNGLFQQATNVTAGGTTDTFTLGLTAFAALVDGRYSRGMGDLRGIIGSSTFGHYMGLYHGGSGDMAVTRWARSNALSIANCGCLD